MFLGEQVTSTNLVKNLGVVMDQHLTWEYHVQHILNRCFGILIGLLNAKHVIPQEVLPTLIDSLVMSHVRYCVQVYGSAGTTVTGKIQAVFNFAARVISGRRKFHHILDVLSELNWLNAEQFVHFNDLCLFHKMLSLRTPDVLSSRYYFNHDVWECLKWLNI